MARARTTKEVSASILTTSPKVLGELLATDGENPEVGRTRRVAKGLARTQDQEEAQVADEEVLAAELFPVIGLERHVGKDIAQSLVGLAAEAERAEETGVAQE